MRLWTDLGTLGGALLMLALSAPDGCAVRQVDTVEANEPENAIPIENLAHLTMVKTLINGEGPYDFVLDTGAGVTVLNSELVHTLKIPVVGTMEVGSPMGAEPIQADSLRVRSIQVGDVVLEDMPAIALELNDLFLPLKAPDGILSAASFEGFLVTIDFPNQFVQIRKGALPPADGQRVLDYSPDSVVPNISVSIAGETVQVAIDTGAPSPLVLPRKYISTLPLESEPTVAGQGRTVDATFEILSSQLKGTLNIGDITIDNPTITFNDGGKHPHIGMSVLRNYSLTIDRTNHRLMFEQPQQASTSGSPTRRIVRPGGTVRYGIRMAGLGGDVLDVIGVDAGLAAAQGGLAGGDRIVAMNGRLVQSLTREERIAALRGSPLVLSIERDGDELELVLSLGTEGS